MPDSRAQGGSITAATVKLLTVTAKRSFGDQPDESHSPVAYVARGGALLGPYALFELHKEGRRPSIIASAVLVFGES